MSQVSVIKQKFKSAIRRGTGEAYLLMQSHPKLDFSRDIIQACLENFAYDRQCESDREYYLFELIALFGKKDKIRDAILKGLITEQHDTWALTQLFALAKMFALQGDEEAKRAIYDRFLVNHIAGSDWAGTSEILALDGMAGMLFIAEKLGEALENDPEDWQDDTTVRFFHERNPQLDVWGELETAAQSNRFIKKYFDEVVAAREKRLNYKRDEVVYKDVIDEVLSNKAWRFTRRKLNDEELGLIAKRLLVEKNKQKKQKLLAIFSKYKFPLDPQFMIDIATKTVASAKRVRELALSAMRFLKSDAIREFAIEGITSGRNPDNFAWAFVANYQDGDEVLLASIVDRAKNEHVIECLNSVYMEIFKANPTTKCKAPLMALYNNTNCGICRSGIVRLLIENEALPDEIKEEIKFDCADETRALADSII